MLINVASNVVHDAGKFGLTKLAGAFTPSAMDGAIAATLEQCGGTPKLGEYLRTWLEGQQVFDVAVSWSAGSIVSVERLAESFMAASSPQSAEISDDQAKVIITCFLNNLAEVLRENGHFNTAVVEDIGRQTLDVGKQILCRLEGQDSSSTADSIKSKLETKVGTARELLSTGNVKAAQSILVKTRDEAASAQAPIELHLDIAIQLGKCALRLEEWDAAKQEFERATRLKTDSAKGWSNLGQLHVLLNEPEDAVRCAIEAYAIEPQDPLVKAVRLAAFYLAKRWSEISPEEQDPNKVSEIESLLVIGQVAYDEGQYSDSANAYQKILDIRPSETQALLLKAQCLLRPTELRHFEAESFKLSERESLAMSEAENLLTDAIAAFESNDYSLDRSRAYMLRAGARFFLGDLQNAVGDFDSVPNSDRMYVRAQMNKAILLSQLGDFEGARSTLKALRSSQDPEILCLLAESYIRQKEFAEALLVLQPALEHSDNDYLVEVIERALIARRELGQPTEDLIQRLDELESNGVASASPVKAMQFLRDNKESEAVEILKRSILDCPNIQETVRAKLVYAYCIANDLDAALEEYGQLSADYVAGREALHLVTALVSGGRKSDALKMLLDIRAQFGVVKGFAEHEAELLVEAGDVQKAKDIFEQLLQSFPGDYRYQLRLANLTTRLGQGTATDAILAAIDAKEMDSDPTSMMRLCYIHLFRGNTEEALQLAYKARQIGIDDPDIHLAYIDIFLRCKPSLDVTEVKEQTTVTLTRTGEEKRHYTIVPTSEPGSEYDIVVTDVLAQKLLGKQVGQTVVLRDDGFGKLEYGIEQVRHRFVAAFQSSMSDFSARFPEAKGLTQVSDPNFAHFFASVERHDQLVQQARNWYRSAHITLEGASQVIGNSPIDFWLATTNELGSPFYARPGLEEHSQKEIHNLRGAKELVLDITSLLTLAELGILDKLDQLQITFYVSQLTLDLINHQLFDMLYEPSKSYVGKSQGRYTFGALDDQVLKHRKDLCDSIRSFITAKTQIVGSTKKLMMSDDDLELRNMLGRSTYSSILIAQETGKCLLADDFALTSFAESEENVAGASTLALLELMHERKLINSHDLKNHLCLLAARNYYFLPVNDELLVFPLEKSNGTVTAEAARMVDRLADPRIDLQEAARVGGQFLKLVWLRVLIPDQRTWIVELLIKALTKRRQPKPVLTVLKSIVRQQFSLMSHHADEILEMIDWYL